MKRILLFLIALLVCPSCSVIQKQPIDFTAPEAQRPKQTEYYVRTRIVIEYINVVLQDKDSFPSAMMFAADFKAIKDELKIAELVYSKIGLKFHIVHTDFRQYGDYNSELLEDAALYPDDMSLYFRLPRTNEQFEGLSSVPYENLHQYGILLSFSRNPWTLAHEVGHYFGLLHTFQDDFCADTPSDPHIPCTIEDETKNCHNIMNYCIHGPKIVTHDQLERMDRFIRSRRWNVIINPPPRTPLFDIEEFFKEVESTSPNPTPLFEDIESIFNTPDQFPIPFP